jgi:Family of unknown function (DUF6535)
VDPHLCAFLSSISAVHTDSSIVDRFILHCCCFADLGVNSGHSSEPTGHLQLLLANILVDPNRPDISTPSPSPFTPPNYAVWVNGLWFLSLMISITCALLATLLQQWAQRYPKATQPHLSLHKRARIPFSAEGVEKSFLPFVVEALPTLIHISLSLFFAGLVVFLWHVNLTIYKMALSWVGVCAAFYRCITLVPIFCRDSPHYTLLMPLAGTCFCLSPSWTTPHVRWTRWNT